MDTGNKIFTNDGDESMKNANVIYPKLDVSLILGKGKVISSHEALEDIIPIQWGEDVLNGQYRDKTIIKSKDEEDK